MTIEQKKNAATQPSAYEAPKLRRYGKMFEVTAAGSLGETEVRPNGTIDNSPNKSKP